MADKDTTIKNLKSEKSAPDKYPKPRAFFVNGAVPFFPTITSEMSIRVLRFRSPIRVPGEKRRHDMCANRLHVVCFKAPWMFGQR